MNDHAAPQLGHTLARHFSKVAKALTLSVALAAAGASLARAQDAVKVSFLPTAAVAPLFVAVEKGYFKAENLDVQLVSTAVATDAVTMAATGQVDVGTAAVGSSLFNAAARGLDFRLVASLAIHPAPTTITPLLIRKDLWDSGKVRSGADLRGQRVSTNSPGGSIEYKLALILQKYGMTMKDVQGVPLGLPETLNAFQSGGIAAAVIGEPFATAALKRGLAVMQVEDSGEMVGDIGFSLVYSESFIDKRRAVGVRFLKAMIKAAGDLQPGSWKTQENIDIIAKYTKLPADTISEMSFPAFDPQLDPEKYVDSMKRQAEMHAKNGRIGPAAVAAAGTITDASFVRDAAAP